MKKTIAIILVILLLFGGFFATGLFNFGGNTANDSEITESQEVIPQFKQEGELFFPEEKQKIAIEVADNEAEITQGLMYRRSMPDTTGMLFIMPKTEEQVFWMKNTHIPLDMIFIDEDKKIVTIQVNTIPFSEKRVPSFKPAKYVLEVNAGFCQRRGIDEGEIVDFRIK